MIEGKEKEIRNEDLEKAQSGSETLLSNRTTPTEATTTPNGELESPKVSQHLSSKLKSLVQALIAKKKGEYCCCSIREHFSSLESPTGSTRLVLFQPKTTFIAAQKQLTFSALFSILETQNKLAYLANDVSRLASLPRLSAKVWESRWSKLMLALG